MKKQLYPIISTICVFFFFGLWLKTKTEFNNYIDNINSAIFQISLDSYFIGCRDHIQNNEQCHRDALKFLQDLVNVTEEMRNHESSN